MSKSRRLGSEWTEGELIVVLDMYFNEGMRDSHGFDEVAMCMGRYNASTNSYHDGAVNEKIAEIIGLVEFGRKPRNPGDLLASLVARFSTDLLALRVAARQSWPEILTGNTAGTPSFVNTVLRTAP